MGRLTLVNVVRGLGLVEMGHGDSTWAVRMRHDVKGNEGARCGRGEKARDGSWWVNHERVRMGVHMSGEGGVSGLGFRV